MSAISPNFYLSLFITCFVYYFVFLLAQWKWLYYRLKRLRYHCYTFRLCYVFKHLELARLSPFLFALFLIYLEIIFYWNNTCRTTSLAIIKNVNRFSNHELAWMDHFRPDSLQFYNASYRDLSISRAQSFRLI